MNRLNYTLLAWLLPLWLFAQPSWEAAVFMGGSNYLGDLVEDQWPVWQETKPAIGLSGGWYPDYRLGIQAGIAVGQISGDDANYKDPVFAEVRNIRFKSNLAEASLRLLYEPWGRRRFPASGGFRFMRFSPYLFAGAGVVWYQPQPDFSQAPRSRWAAQVQQDKEAVEARSYSLAVPMGGGIKTDLSKRTFLAIELGLRATRTDHLDGISYTGKTGTNDWYMFGGLHLGRRLGPDDYDRDGIPDKEDRCPRIAGVASAKGCPDADGDGVEDLEDMCPNEYGLPALSGCPDRDGDGVPDHLDVCPDTPGKEITLGCPDRDDDNIADDDDECPDVPGLPEFKGCPDTDGDGIQDSEDECPDVPGFAQFKGCPFSDIDKDGIPDEDDACPEVSGLPEFDGCPDTDGDGVGDHLDKCPDVPGSPDMEGCPDTDGDGVADHLDKCPDVPGDSLNRGCPVLSKKAQKTLALATKTVAFQTGSAKLTKASFTVLKKVAAILKEYPYYAVDIGGHTDSQGNDAANMRLSEKRANTCLLYLKQQGIAPERLQAKGFGETAPIATNKTAAGRRLNRRVTFDLFVK